MEKIYLVFAISLTEKTEEILEKEYRIECARHNKELNRDKFMALMKDIKEDKYEISGFLSGFYKNKKEAEKVVTNNIADINEAGAYKYAAICAADIGVAYYNSYQNIETDFDVYKYNVKKDRYEPLTKENEEYNPIVHYVWGYF